MSLDIFLASDLHLGMKFAGYPGAQGALVEARFTALRNVVTAANEAGSDLLVIAGDLFERVGVAVRDIARAAEALRGFQGRLVAVLPGNHDYHSPGDTLWPKFRESCGDAVMLLDQPRPYPLRHYDLEACLYPGPCGARHSATHAVGWVRAAVKDGSLRHHIGVAHGSLEGFSPDIDERYYPMRASELLEAGVHLWLLGHTHERYPERPGARDRIFYAGTPEPDGFDCRHEGGAWHLRLDDDGAVSARAVRTGSLRFVEERVEVRSAEDLERVERRYGGDEARSVLLRLLLEGRVPRDLIAGTGALGTRMARKLLHLELHADGLREEITREAIDREYPAGSFPHLLLMRLSESGDQDAMEAAHSLLQRLRS